MNAGGSIEAVRRRLGHASAETTQLYALLDDKVADAAIKRSTDRQTAQGHRTLLHHQHRSEMGSLDYPRLLPGPHPPSCQITGIRSALADGGRQVAAVPQRDGLDQASNRSTNPSR
ncbi:hypothetical protein [Nonomuraea sp. LPB2021202275-12-8]|uniref:hypothetical protein n=1 Tax=Nonomuraea sp. LPB2021202275-12-8 TaxID=3120159 RepID=UPI003FA61371